MKRNSNEFSAELEKEKAKIADEYRVTPRKQKKSVSTTTQVLRLVNSACKAQPVITGALVGLASGAIHKDYVNGALYGAAAGSAASMLATPQIGQIVGSTACAVNAHFNYESNEHFTRNQQTALSFVLFNAVWDTLSYLSNFK